MCLLVAKAHDVSQFVAEDSDMVVVTFVSEVRFANSQFVARWVVRKERSGEGRTDGVVEQNGERHFCWYSVRVMEFFGVEILEVPEMNTASGFPSLCSLGHSINNFLIVIQRIEGIGHNRIS